MLLPTYILPGSISKHSIRNQLTSHTLVKALKLFGDTTDYYSLAINTGHFNFLTAPIGWKFDRTKTAPARLLLSWLRFRIDVGAPAKIRARISHLAELETACVKNAHAAAGAAADRQRPAKEVHSSEIPEGQSFRGTPVPDAPAYPLRISNPGGRRTLLQVARWPAHRLFQSLCEFAFFDR
jgi:hypothetical protein